MRQVTLRFEGHGAPVGQMKADRAAAVATALDHLVLRLTREAASAAGLGRPGTTIERLGEVRLTGISAGSAVLTFQIGDAEALTDSRGRQIDPLAEHIDTMFHAIVCGISRNDPPAFMTPTIKDATLRFVGALQRAAPVVDVTNADDAVVRVLTTHINREVWLPRAGEAAPATLAGRLEALDFRNGHFRLVDDVGNRIELVEVLDLGTAAELANQRVLAEGLFCPATATSKARLESVTLRPFELPDRLLPALQPSVPPAVTAGAEHARMPDEFALSDEELDAFLAAIHD